MERKSVVLIVYSRRLLLDLLIEYVRKEELQAVGADSGEEAQKLFNRHRPDLVVLDTSADGAFPFLEHFRSLDTPCALIALADTEEIRRRLVDAGVEIILSRSANLKALVKAMETYLSRILERRAGESAKILLVDDDADVIQLLTVFLRGLGYAVLAASDGEQAIQTLAQHPGTGVVLLDIRLPGMGGIELLTRIMSNGRHPEVIVVSGINDTEIARLAVKRGAFDYIPKPFDLQRLEGVIAACLGRVDYRKKTSLRKLIFKALSACAS